MENSLSIGNLNIIHIKNFNYIFLFQYMLAAAATAAREERKE